MIPEPLVPPDCDLRDFGFMPLEIARLFGSEFHSHSNDSEWRAGVTLWLKSYHQVPAASMLDDDISLARSAEFGVQVKAWMKVRAGALRGWIKCSDGRLYHPVVAEKALEAWLDKLNARKSSGAGNAKRHGTSFDSGAIDEAINVTTEMLRKLNPNSRKLKTVRPGWKNAPDPLPVGDVLPPDGSQSGASRESRSAPDPLPVGSQQNRREQKRKEDTSSLRSDVCSEPASRSEPESPAVISLETNRQGEFFIVTEAHVAEFKELYPDVNVEQELRKMRGWLLGNPKKRKTKSGMLRFANSWMARQQDKGASNGTTTYDPAARRNRPGFDAVLEGLALDADRHY